MKKFNQLFILGTSLLLSAAALTGCSGSSAMGATIPQTTASETTTPQTDAGLVAAETTGSGNRLNDILERGYIEIATEPYFAPNEFIDPTKSGDDAYVGSDIELANYIGESLGDRGRTWKVWKDCDACIRRRFDQKIGSLRRNEISAHGSWEGDRGFFRDHAESYICEGTGRCSSCQGKESRFYPGCRRRKCH